MRCSAIALALTVSLTLPSLAATVQSVQGQVLVNRGAGFQPAQAGATANPGAVVAASPGGSAQLVYPDGCVVNVSPGATVTVGQQSPCALGQIDYTPYVVGGVVVTGAVAGAIILLTQKDDKPASQLLTRKDDKPASQ